MRFAEARREARAEDLELAVLLREPELDAVPVEPRRPVPFAGRNRRDAQLADMPAISAKSWCASIGIWPNMSWKQSGASR